MKRQGALENPLFSWIVIGFIYALKEPQFGCTVTKPDYKFSCIQLFRENFEILHAPILILKIKLSSARFRQMISPSYECHLLCIEPNCLFRIFSHCSHKGLLESNL